MVRSATAAMLLGTTVGPTQVLARPGWAGSGVSVEPWWRHAVIYRIDPAKFQDSNLDGVGDIAGVTKRLDYLQSLGVDAILIDNVPAAPAKVSGSANAVSADPNAPVVDPNAAPADDGFDDLFQAAAGVHLRVLVNVGVPAQRTNVEDAAYLGRARMWLSRGAAGLYVPTRELVNSSSNEAAVYFVRQMRSFTDGMPGEHVVMADQAAEANSAIAEAVGRSAQLVLTPPIHLAPGTTESASGATDLASQGGQAEAADLRQQLTNRLGGNAAQNANGTAPVLRAARVEAKLLSPAQTAGLRRSLAVVLLGSRAAVMLEYGQELGLEPLAGSGTAGSGAAGSGAAGSGAAGSGAAGSGAAGDRSPLMQWTPANLTEMPPVAPAASEETHSTGSAKGKGYAAFKEYVKPLRRDLFPPPKLPNVVIGENPPPPDVNMLPGFTGGTTDAALQSELRTKVAAITAPNAEAANVAMEKDDVHSMLTLYRRLIQLHHANASLRSGTQQMVDEDAAGAVVWLRQPPAGASASTVMAVCNMGGKALELPLSQVALLRLREAALRDLRPGTAVGKAVGRESVVKVPAFGVVMVAVER